MDIAVDDCRLYECAADADQPASISLAAMHTDKAGKSNKTIPGEAFLPEQHARHKMQGMYCHSQHLCRQSNVPDSGQVSTLFGT